MSETTPDPADVHTSTDRVELTDGEYDQLSDALKLEPPTPDAPMYYVGGIDDVVASIVAARVQALTAELEAERYEWRQMRAARDAARAELAAANTRCAELSENLDRLSTEIMDQNAENWGDQPLTDDEKALLLRFDALSVVLDKSEAKNAALQETLDRVTDVLDEYCTAGCCQHAESNEKQLHGVLRAALTPEGTE